MAQNVKLSDTLAPVVQLTLVEERRAALHGEASSVFEMATVPQVNRLVAWEGRYDHAKNLCAPVFVQLSFPSMNCRQCLLSSCRSHP